MDSGHLLPALVLRGGPTWVLPPKGLGVLVNLLCNWGGGWTPKHPKTTLRTDSRLDERGQQFPTCQHQLLGPPPGLGGLCSPALLPRLDPLPSSKEEKRRVLGSCDPSCLHLQWLLILGRLASPDIGERAVQGRGRSAGKGEAVGRGSGPPVTPAPAPQLPLTAAGTVEASGPSDLQSSDWD